MTTLAQRLPARLARWSKQLEAAELLYSVDAYTLAAVIDRESLGGEALQPPGPNGLGDGGRGHGLGQIDSGSHAGFIHAEFWDHVPLWADPTFNILYAARLFRRNLDSFGGQDYLAAIASYNCGTKRAKEALGALTQPASVDAKTKALDAATTGGNYVSDVLARRDKFLEAEPKPKEAV